MVDDRLTQVRWLNLDSVMEPKVDIGVTGLVAGSDQSVFLAIQSSAPRLVALDPEMRPTHTWALAKARDPHSLAFVSPYLYIASSSSNRVFSIDVRESGVVEQEVFASHPDSTSDQVHVNGVAATQDGLALSQFGLRRGNGSWGRRGQVIDCASDRVITGDLAQPHSLTATDSGLVVLSSAEGSVVRVDHGGSVASTHVGGYLRGLGVSGRTMVIGRSAWRPASRLLGGMKRPPQSRDPHGNPWQRSSLIRINFEGTVHNELDFTPYGAEIYDVLPLDVEVGPDHCFEHAALRRIDSLREVQVRLSSD